MSVIHLWSLDQSVLGCGRKSREKVSLDQALDWARQKESKQPVPSLVWRTELALVVTRSGYPTNDKSVVKIFKAFGFSSHELAMVDHLEFDLVSRETKGSSLDSKANGVHSFKIIGAVSGLLWTWDPSRRLTRGVMYSSTEHLRATTKMHLILEGIKRHADLRKSPLLLGLCVLRAYTIDSKIDLYLWGRQLVETHIKTGRHNYPSFARSLEVKDLDLAGMSSDVCGIAVSLSNCALRLQALSRLSNFISDECSTLNVGTQTALNTSVSRKDITDGDQRFKALAVYWKVSTESCLNEAKSLQWRSEIVLQTIFTLTTQRDQDISIQIARDSRTLAQQAKRDSSSMKAIAAVTMFFLPGTFVASLFATPMFAWTVAPGRSVSSQFWIYWAGTLPLTFLVVTIWLGWTNRNDILRFLNSMATTKRKHDLENNAPSNVNPRFETFNTS